MFTGPSALSLIAAFFYGIVASSALLAAVRARSERQISWHFWAWVAVAALFVLLAVLRVFAVEEWLRSDLRAVLYDHAAYEQRRRFQGPLVVICLGIGAALAAGLVFYVAKGVSGRRNIMAILALACTGGMLFLAALRLISLHALDDILYGPLKINWVADIGLSFAVMACAWRYRMVVQRKAR